MSLFRYKAVDGNGVLLQGELDAATEQDVFLRLKAMGHAPISAELRGRSWQWLRLPQRRRRVLPVARFARDVGTLLAAGVALERALSMLVDMAQSPREAAVISELLDAVRNGQPLSAAMERHGAVFSRFHVNMVRAGEASGALDKVLLRLADAAEQVDALRDSVKTALIYPSLLVLVTGASLMILMTFVVPQFTVLFTDMGRELPLPTRIVSAAGEWLRGYWWLLLLALFALFRLAQWQWSAPRSRYRWELRLARWPLLGDVLLKLQMALFARTFATLLGNGVPLLAALQIVRETLASHVMQEAVGEVAAGVKDGGTLAGQMAQAARFPALAVHLVRVGEETGQLEGMLLRLAEIFEREVRTAVQRALALLEPVLIIGLGVIVGGIIMSILVAILSINDLTL
jgi:general secretion pathway protein F